MAKAQPRRKGGNAGNAGKARAAARPKRVGEVEKASNGDRARTGSAGRRPATPSVAVAGFELGELRQLIRLVQRTGIGELEIDSGGRSVRISAASAGGGAPGGATNTVSVPAGPPAAPPAAARALPAGEPATEYKAITSPMVGTFYRSPAPDADPFVEVGDVVEVGQTVCIVEAMKLMNEIEAEIKGRVVRIVADNAQAVEFGQKLFLVEPV